MADYIVRQIKKGTVSHQAKGVSLEQLRVPSSERNLTPQDIEEKKIGEDDTLVWESKKVKVFLSPVERPHRKRLAKKRKGVQGAEAPLRWKGQEKDLSGEPIKSTEFEDKFEFRDLLILGEEMRLPFADGDGHFPQSDTKGFWIQYDYEDEAEPVKRRLPHSGLHAIFSKDVIFNADPNDPSNGHSNPDKASNFKIFYLNEDTGKQFPDEPVALNGLKFIDGSEIKEELQELMEDFLELKRQMVEDAIIIIRDEFALDEDDDEEETFFDDNLNDWLKDNLGFYNL